MNQSYINTKAYSLYLNDHSSSTGSILFGGIDTEKFAGNLTGLSIILDIELATSSSPNGIAISFEVVLSYVSVNGQAGNTTTFSLFSTASDGSSMPAIGVILDSGSTLTFLPSNSIPGIYSILSAVVNKDDSANIWVNCDLLTSTQDLTTNFQFTNFSTSIIKVPISELVYKLADYVPIGSHASFKNLPFKNTCIFGILDSSNADGASILGDTFQIRICRL